MDDVKQILRAIDTKVCLAKGREKDKYENMVLQYCDTSFQFGALSVIDGISSILGKDVVDSALSSWLKD